MPEHPVPAAHTARDVASTAGSLQEELVRLEIQKQALERELAAVAAHLGSVRQALGTLRGLLAEPAPGSARGGAAAGPRRTYGRLTDQIMDYFAGVGGADVRARDVAAALSRDGDSGSINAVRGTLDRLVASSRLRRTGRGLYRGAAVQ